MIQQHRHQLYEAFQASEARRLVERFEWHDTPKRGSWLDLAESELAATAPMPRSEHSATDHHEEISGWENTARPFTRLAIQTNCRLKHLKAVISG